MNIRDAFVTEALPVGVKPVSRRTVVQSGLIAGMLVPFAAVFVGGRSQATVAALTPLSPDEPTAKARGYILKSEKVDQHCDNCTLYRGKPGDLEGGCLIFPAKSVASGAWCKSWVKRPT